MSRKCRRVSLGEETFQLSRETESVIPVTDWRYFTLCQRETEEKLVKPSDKKCRSSDKKSGYTVIAKNILDFSEIGLVPLDIDLRRLDNGQGIEETFVTNKAVWHKTCWNKFDEQKLQHAQKRKLVHDKEQQQSPIKTRLSIGECLARTDKGFFCNNDNSNEHLHSAVTMAIDRHVREYAHILQDRILLGKLSEGDMPALD